MGRPFILYDDDETCHDICCKPSPSTSHPTFELWAEAARKALLENKILDEQGDNPSFLAEISAILSYIYSRQRIAFLPNCEPAPEGGLGLFASKVGGVPYLLPSESWPCNNGKGLTHLWQLRVNELPAAVQRALGYSRGLLQVFLSDTLDEDEDDDEDEGRWFLVRVLDESQLVYRDASEIVPGPDTDLLDEQRVTSYTCAYDFPRMEDALEELPDGLEVGVAADVICVLQEAGLYDTVPGDKLLGWPRWPDTPEWRFTGAGQPYVQVMQVEGSVAPLQVRDGGILLLQRHPTDRQRWDVSWAAC